jgi:YidC/Oxa1 family membrane protein insertase
MMPVMMLLWFNQYSAGLSYYYFLSNIITIGQTMIIRKYVDDDKVLLKLNENKKKPKKKSKFQAKLDEMAKQQREQAKKNPKKR